MNKFDNLFNLIMEDITSQRKPIKKVDAMSPKDFIAFLKDFLPYVKNGKVDLNDIRISEKVDGQSLKLLTVNGEMRFESSYSGVTTWENVPMKEAAKFLYDNYSQLFEDIHDLIGSDFKLIGELIWIDEMEETGKVTPVAAPYLTNKFGRYGGMVVFDIYKVTKDAQNEKDLIPFPEEKEMEIFDMIRDLNNEDFSFYLIDSIDITKNVTFNLDVDQLIQLVNNPEFNKEKFTKADAKLVEQIEQIKANVCAQLSKTIEHTKGAFSEEGDLIEGIVVKILDSGNQYGMFSSGYRDRKHVFWDSFNQLEPIYTEFFKEVFGCIPVSKKKIVIPKLEQDFNQFKAKYEELRPIYIKRMQDAYKQLIADQNVPKAAKRVQLSMAQEKLNKLMESDYKTFIDKYVMKNKYE